MTAAKIAGYIKWSLLLENPVYSCLLSYFKGMWYLRNVEYSSELGPVSTCLCLKYIEFLKKLLHRFFPNSSFFYFLNQKSSIYLRFYLLYHF